MTLRSWLLGASLLVTAGIPMAGAQVPELPPAPAPEPAAVVAAACDAVMGSPAPEEAKAALGGTGICPEEPDARAGNAPHEHGDAPAPVADAQDEAQDLGAAAQDLAGQAQGFAEQTIADPLGTPERAPGFLDGVVAWLEENILGPVQDLVGGLAGGLGELPAGASAGLGAAGDALGGARASAQQGLGDGAAGFAGALQGAASQAGAALQGVADALGALLGTRGAAPATNAGGLAGRAGDAVDIDTPVDGLLDRLEGALEARA